MNRLFWLSLFILSVYSTISFADKEAITEVFMPCPKTITEAKKMFSETKSPKLTDKCYNQLLQHLSNGEATWINEAQSLTYSDAIGFNEGIPIAMTYAITKNPTLMLQIIDRESSFDAYKKWCVSPFTEATADEITFFDNTAIAALKNVKVSPYFEKLRQQCINNFIQDRDHTFKCKLLTPEAIVSSVQHDQGQQLLFGNDQCDIMLSYQLIHLKPEWLATLPILTSEQTRPELREYIRDVFVRTLSNSPETALKALSQYYGQQQLAQACQPNLHPAVFDDKDAGIKIESDPYHNPDNYKLNVPKAIQALGQLKLTDPNLTNARDVCLKGLQQSLRELQQKEQQATQKSRGL